MAAASVVLAVACGGCRLLGGRRTQPTQLDRLMAAYPELRSGRFVVIADFEDPRHMEIVHLRSASPEAGLTRKRSRGGARTGERCVEFARASDEDAILINNDGATNWYLKRDWRDYDLLILHIKAPRSDLRATVRISAEEAEKRVSVASSIPLQKGWNAVRLDLADVGEHIPLDDVQEVQISIAGCPKRIKVNLDDIILAGAREDLFGNAANRHGGLYVRKAGRRWDIGAGGRFELTFANGQIVRWYNLASDPYRLRNLVEGTVLGPSVVITDSDGGTTTDLTRLGDRIVARSRILEMSTVRTVINCEWWFAAEDHADLPRDSPFQSWTYTVYPSGQIYVAATRSASRLPSLAGFTVTMAGGETDGTYTHVQTENGQPAAEGMPRYATVRSSKPDAILMFVPGNQQQLRRLDGRIDVDRNRISFTAITAEPGTDDEFWPCHIFLGAGTGEVRDNEIPARAAAYIHPARLTFELGEAVGGLQVENESTGFDPFTGCYTIAPDEGRVRFRVDARERPSFSPAFRILSDNAAEAWVYVNQFVFDNVARDMDGNIIFQLPGVVRGQTVVEVFFSRPSSPSDG